MDQGFRMSRRDGQPDSLMLQTLPLDQQLSMAPLAVFPSTFDEEGAEAVLGCSSKQVLQLMNHLGLLHCDSVPGQYHLHKAVRARRW